MAKRVVVAMHWDDSKQGVAAPNGMQEICDLPSCGTRCKPRLNSDVGVTIALPGPRVLQTQEPAVVLAFSYDDADPTAVQAADAWLVGPGAGFHFVQPLVMVPA